MDSTTSHQTVDEEDNTSTSAARHSLNNAVEAIARLVAASERSGASDLASALRIHVDALLAGRDVDTGIEGMANASSAAVSEDPSTEPTPESSQTPPAAVNMMEDDASPRSPSAPPTCISCEEPIAAETAWQEAWQAPCKHWYCVACLEQLFRIAMVDTAFYPPRCCAILPWYDVVALLPEDLANDFMQKKDELDTPEHERVYCARPRCSHFLGSKKTLGGIAACTECDYYTCTACGFASHAGPCPTHPEEAMQQTLRLAREKGWQTCRQCKRIVDKLHGGCDHVRCSCGRMFCYACGENLDACACADRADIRPELLRIEDFLAAHPQLASTHPQLNVALLQVERHRRQFVEAQDALNRSVAELSRLAAAVRDAAATNAG